MHDLPGWYAVALDCLSEVDELLALEPHELHQAHDVHQADELPADWVGSS